MRIGITEWNGRVSPVCDVATRLLVADIEDGVILDRRVLTAPPGFGVIELIPDSGVSELVCGACSRVMEWRLRSMHVRPISWVSGDIEEVLDAYTTGRDLQGEFPMPGCRGCGYRRRRHGRHRERRFR